MAEKPLYPNYAGFLNRKKNWGQQTPGVIDMGEVRRRQELWDQTWDELSNRFDLDAMSPERQDRFTKLATYYMEKERPAEEIVTIASSLDNPFVPKTEEEFLLRDLPRVAAKKAMAPKTTFEEDNDG